MVAALQGKRRFKNEVYGQLARIGKALASPKRLELLDLICQAERSVEQLANETAMSVANTSQHLRTLHEAHLVEARKEGRFVVYGLADALVSDFYRSFRNRAHPATVFCRWERVDGAGPRHTAGAREARGSGCHRCTASQ